MAVIMSKQMVIPELTYWEKYAVNSVTEVVDLGSAELSFASSATLVCSATEPTRDSNGWRYVYANNKNMTISEYASVWQSYPYIALWATDQYAGYWYHISKYNGISSGEYKFTRDRGKSIENSTSKGALIGVVFSSDANAYPNDGISGNYWYVKVVA